jgi:hypothetical protein
LPITFWAIALVLSGTAAGALIRGHSVLAGLSISLLWLAGTWRGVRYLWMARSDPPAALGLTDPPRARP